jgi:hypothetical protein
MEGGSLSRGGTSRMTRECQVRFCEGLGVKFRGPTRQSRRSDRARFNSGLPRLADILRASRHVSKVPKPEISPNAKPLDARGAARRIRFVAWQRLSGLASVFGEQQRHQLIDRCR